MIQHRHDCEREFRKLSSAKTPQPGVSLVFGLQLEHGLILADEQLDDLLVVVVGGVVYGRPAVLVGRQHVGVVGDEAGDRVERAAACRQVQRRRACGGRPAVA